MDADIFGNFRGIYFPLTCFGDYPAGGSRDPRSIRLGYGFTVASTFTRETAYSLAKELMVVALVRVDHRRALLVVRFTRPAEYPSHPL